MYLRRFADERQQLVMRPRDDAARGQRITVRKACAEVGYYAIATEDVEPPHDEGHDPELVERIFAAVEGETDALLRGILSGGFPPQEPEARFRISMFIALQITRGWAFRRDLEELGNLSARHYVETQATPERVTSFLKERGLPHGDRHVQEFLQRALGPNGPRLVLPQARAVQEMLRFAIEFLMPDIFSRRWRLLEFDEPRLLTSDEPVALWSPEGAPAGVRNAPAIWLPLDRTHALGLVRAGAEKIVSGSPTRARIINVAVAEQAERWIFHHPDDDPLAEVALGPRRQLVDEVVDVVQEGDQVRELHRFVKRPVIEAATASAT
jgi:hypothetical protein